MPHLPTRALTALAGALVLCSSAPARSSDLFLDLDIEQALERAKAEEKLVFVFWTSAGNPECRRMEVTYSDETVVAWIKERAVPIRIRGDEKQRLAVQYVVGTFPQAMVLSAEGTVLDRIAGFYGPEEFATMLEASAVARASPVDRPEGDSAEDPLAWLAYANYLYGLRQEPEEVRDAYLFCLDSGEKLVPGFETKYLDLILNRLMLMHRAIPTVPDLQSRRDRLGRSLSEGRATRHEAIAYARYNFWLLDVAATVAKFDELGWEGDSHKALRAVLFDQILVELVSQRRYSDVTECAGDILAGLRARIEACKMPGDQAPEEDDSEPSAEAKNGFRDDRSAIITDGVNYYEALLASGQGKTAGMLVDLLVEAYPTGRTYSLLMQHAARVDMFDLSRALAARGRKEVGAKGEKMIQRALRKLPPDQRNGDDAGDEG